MRRAGLLAAALVAALFASPRGPRAAGAAVLDLAVERCPQIDEARLRELLVIELGTVRPTGAGDVDVRLVCDGARVAMDLRDRVGGRSFHAEVDLAATPEATRLRLLVLAVTEQWSIERAAPTPAPEAPRAAPAGAPVVARAAEPPARPPEWRVYGKAAARRVGEPGLWLAGGGAGLERALTRRWGLTLNLVAAQGEVATPVASVTARELVATAGLVVSAEAGRWSFSAVPGVSVGLVSLAATPRAADARGATLDAAWAGPLLEACARLELGRAAYVVAEAGAGVTTRRVTGLVDGQATLFALRGPWLQLGLGAGWRY